MEFTVLNGFCDDTGCNNTGNFADVPTVNMLIEGVVSGNKYNYNASSFLNVGFDDGESSIAWNIDPISHSLTSLTMVDAIGNDSAANWLSELRGSIANGVSFDEAKCPEDCDGFVDSRLQTTGQVTATLVANPPQIDLGDVVVAFEQGAGTWKWVDDANWVHVHTQASEQMVTGDFNGNGEDDLVMSFGANGLWVWWDDTWWEQLHPLPSEQLATGDLDGDGADDILVSFAPRFGLWKWMNGKNWVKLHSLPAEQMVVSDLDGDGRHDAIISFPNGAGTWKWMNNRDWVKLHSLSAEGLSS